MLRPDGTYAEWYDGFTYVGPPARQPPLDLTNLDLDTLLSLAMRAWPYLLSVILLVEALRSVRDISRGLKARRPAESQEARFATFAAAARIEMPERGVATASIGLSSGHAPTLARRATPVLHR